MSSCSAPTSPTQDTSAHAFASNGLEILQAASDAAQAIENPQALQYAAAAAEAVSQQQQQQQHGSFSGISGVPQGAELPHHLVPGPGPGGAMRDPSINPKLTRLRRACDLCSRRKVKCDDSNIPCRPCRELGADCTWERETKRRGPPNKHAEAAKAAKRARMESAPAGPSAAPPSPQHAAKTLLDISVDGILNAESIAPVPVLELMVDDFFTYIHPLAPFPHEPTFRQSFANREDRSKPEFLGLLASMIAALVSSFPRSAREYLKTQGGIKQFPKAVVLVEKCIEIALLSRGSRPGRCFSKKPKSLDEACSSYFLGLASLHIADRDSAWQFLSETLHLLQQLGFKKPKHPGELPAFGADVYSEEPRPFNHVKDQVGKRLFWCLLLSIGSMAQLGDNDADIIIFPSSTPSLPYPAYPEDVDDICILANKVIPQPERGVSLLTGFRFGIDIYTTRNGIASIELAYGMSSLPWSGQRALVKDGLIAAKSITNDLPPELQLHLAPQQSQSDEADQVVNLDESGLQYVPPMWPNDQPSHDVRNVVKSQPATRRRLQYEIQKANIFVSQLATRSYFVDLYFNLRDVHIAEDLEGQAEEQDADDKDALELMAAERESIVQNLLEILGFLSQRNMEPNGMSLISKMRQVASTLVNDARDRKGSVAVRSEEALLQLIDILVKLDKTGPAAHSRAQDPTQMTPEDEEEELQCWAEFRELQLRFAATGGFTGNLV